MPGPAPLPGAGAIHPGHKSIKTQEPPGISRAFRREILELDHVVTSARLVSRQSTPHPPERSRSCSRGWDRPPPDPFARRPGLSPADDNLGWMTVSTPRALWRTGSRNCATAPAPPRDQNRSFAWPQLSAMSTPRGSRFSAGMPIGAGARPSR